MNAQLSPSTPDPLGQYINATGQRSYEARQSLFVVISTLTLIMTDISALALGFWAAFNLEGWTELLGAAEKPPGDIYLLIAATSIATIFGWFLLTGLYSGRRGVSRLDDATRMIMRITLGIMLSVAIASFILGADLQYSREMLAYAALFSILGVVGGRFIHTGVVGGLRARGYGADRLLIIGAGQIGELVLDKVRRSPQLGFNVIGFVRHRPWPDGQAKLKISDTPVLGLTSELPGIVEQHRIGEIIIALSGVAHEDVLDVIFRVTEFPVAIRVYPDTFRLLTSDVLSISDLNGLPTVRVRTIGLRPLERIIKRALDLSFSVLVLVLVSPLLVLVAALIKLTSEGPVLFVQERVGLDGRAFQVLKFRSMPVNAEAITGPVFTYEQDPRPTRLGRFMRRYSIDELPQFINVLLGEMSIVGPRPERPHFVEQFRQTIPAYMARHHEKAGITGWAQVNGLRGDTSIEERTRYDLYYVENWSIFFDLKIMLKTLLHIFRSDNNAY